MTDYLKKQQGFSLIEMIMTLIVASILGSMMLTYMDSSLGNSLTSGKRLQNIYDLQSAFARIDAHYYELYKKTAYPLWEAAEEYSVGDTVVARSSPFGHIFICISDGKSGMAEPAWLNLPNAVVNDNTVVWQEAGGELDALFLNLSAGTPPDYYYGEYGIVQKEFIVFDGGTEKIAEPSDPRTLLKVTLNNEDGFQMTALYATSY